MKTTPSILIIGLSIGCANPELTQPSDSEETTINQPSIKTTEDTKANNKEITLPQSLQKNALAEVNKLPIGEYTLSDLIK
ncbi:MAG: hypothetical protein OXE99_03645, partial [Cellvibrionales bacterium]|nr:hypothetical protein [Cellvibrionales bacterium]